MTSFWSFYCWLWPHSVYKFSVSTLNFEQVFVSMVWKTSHNVLKTQKVSYLFRNKSCKAYFIQRFIITPNLNKLWTYDQLKTYYEHITNISFSSKFFQGIQSVLPSFRLVIWSALSSLFSRDLIFFLYQTENLFKSFKQRNKLQVFNPLRWQSIYGMDFSICK